MKTICVLFIAALCGSMSVSAVDLPKDSIISLPSIQLGRIYQSSKPSRVGVHDPSIVPYTDSNGVRTYYIFGTHRGCARSNDLRSWSNQGWTYGIVQPGGNVTSTNDFSGVFVTNQTKTVPVLQNGEVVNVPFGPFDTEKWRYTSNNASLAGNQWAPDVIWNPHMRKWCMYMSLNGDNWRSSIALLTSNNITGPYIYQGPVVYSGFQWGEPAGQTYKETDLELVLGKLSAVPSRYLVGGNWGKRWPNNIDPCTFFDEEGELWMCYGSWSGGIFILRLNKENGLRDYTYTFPGINNNSDASTSDPYFGKKIAGGYYSSGEGSYIEHIGDYYYLFITNGGLEAKRGYEMHYFRSKSPDGPYVDASGQSAIYSRYEMNYGPRAGTTAGMRILGTYKWETMNLAELAQGHNSVLLDDDGRAYLIYHTRFNSGNEAFENRVHQLFVNEKGWLVASPFEFNGRSAANSKFTQGDIDTTSICTTNDIVGSYEIMFHPYKVDYENGAYSTPKNVVFKANGTITGDYYGTWKVKRGTSYITLHIRPRGVSEFTDYYGVVLPQTVSMSNMNSIAISAIASNGVSVWACNVDGNYAIDYTYQKGFVQPVTSRQIITEDVDLSAPSTMYWGTTLSWKSNHPELLSDDGKLQVPYEAKGDTTTLVELTYTFQKDNYACSGMRIVRVRTMKSNLHKSGDINSDGAIDTQDVLQIYEYMQQNGNDASKAQYEDVNHDGSVDTQDVLQVYELLQNA